MVVVMKPGARHEEIEALAQSFQKQGLQVGITNGVGCTILGLVGDTTAVDIDKISILPNVERIMRVSEPYKRPTASSIPRTASFRWAV